MIARIEKLDHVLDAKDEKAFLADLAAKKLGTDVSFDEAKAIADLSKKVRDSRAAIKDSDPVGSAARLEYGANYVALQSYVHDLKNAADKTTFADVRKRPLQSAVRGAVALPGLAKSLKASFDDSYAGRQGFRAIFTNPTLWAKNFAHSLEYIAKQVVRKGTDDRVMDAIKADVFSRPNALDGTYKEMKLDVGIDAGRGVPDRAAGAHSRARASLQGIGSGVLRHGDPPACRHC
jgi:hypothetical protein